MDGAWIRASRVDSVSVLNGAYVTDLTRRCDAGLGGAGGRPATLCDDKITRPWNRTTHDPRA